MDIDSSNFSADKYVSSLLQHKSLPELMQRGIAMVSEIKSLDSDMQMLVCARTGPRTERTGERAKLTHLALPRAAQMRITVRSALEPRARAPACHPRARPAPAPADKFISATDTIRKMKNRVEVRRALIAEA